MDTLEEQIINDYTEHQMSISTLVKKYHKKHKTISKLLVDNNISIRKGAYKSFTLEEQQFIIQNIQAHKGFKYVAQELGVSYETIKSWCDRQQIYSNYRIKNRNLKEDFFSTINTEESAYLLGLLYTDGSVRKEGNRMGQLRISLQKRDIEMIKKIKNLLHSDSKILFDNRVGKETVGIEIVSDRIFYDLCKLGCIPNKTYKSQHLPVVPDSFLIPFLRGIFDGDGIFSYQENYNDASIGFVSYSQTVVTEFQELIDNLIQKTEHNKIVYHTFENGSSYRCSWRGRRQILKILSLLYEDANIFLERKYLRYKKLLASTQRIKI